MPPQYHPLQLDERTGEPYLRLPAPHSNIIITPQRMSDLPFSVEAQNDPSVYRWLSGPPFPYLQADAESWLEHVVRGEDALWKALQEDVDGPLELVGGCPVSTIREQNADGTDVFLGCVEFKRHDFRDIEDVEERARLQRDNDAKEAGDPSIVWSFGDYMTPRAHGRGIMTAAIGTLIHQWGVPRMGVRHLLPSVFVGNIGSFRVFEKNGFVLVKTVVDCVDFPAKGDFPAEKRSLQFLEWKADY